MLQRGRRITGLETHYPDLDEMTSGLQPSDLIIIAARPSMGKTSFAMNVAENAAIEDQKVVAMFSLEMSKEALLQRMLCSVAAVDSHRFRTGSIWSDDTRKIQRAMERLLEAPIFIDDTPGISVSEMRAKARRLQQAQKALDLDSSLSARKELAKELKYTGNTNDTATMNVWLHKQVMAKLAANGGKLPADIKT